MVNLILAEFGVVRRNRGEAPTTAERLEPTLGTFKKFFPTSRVTLYTDTASLASAAVDCLKVVEPPFDQSHPRYGYRCNDYYKVKGLLESDDEISMALDSDMTIVSAEVRTLIAFTSRFGACAPANPRLLVKLDGNQGYDGNASGVYDTTGGVGFAYNLSPLSFATRHAAARALYTEYCRELLAHPARGPLVLWRAVWKSGFAPYLLPFQWCVCREYVGIGNEIILHSGHAEVRDFYVGTSD
jgi:hypothetical protein